jgi:hypothetical protein
VMPEVGWAIASDRVAEPGAGVHSSEPFLEQSEATEQRLIGNNVRGHSVGSGRRDGLKRRRASVWYSAGQGDRRQRLVDLVQEGLDVQSFCQIASVRLVGSPVLMCASPGSVSLSG